MKLVHPFLERHIEFKEGHINLLILENQKMFVELIEELLLQKEGSEGKFVLSDEEQIFNFSKKVDVVIDFMNLDLNKKQILNALYKLLDKKSMDENFYEKTSVLKHEIEKYAVEITEEIDMPITHNTNFDMVSIFKALDISVRKEYENLLEKIIDYINICIEFLGIELFVFVNLKAYLLKEELTELYKMAEYQKYFLLLIEPFVREEVIGNEELHIIDKDLCQIL